MMRCAVILLLAYLCLAAPSQTHGLYSPGGALKLLEARNFKQKILDSELPAIVEFYAPWCGHCKSLAPAFTKVAESLHGIVNVAAVDCDVEANKPLCSQYDVKGFPTIKSFSGGKGKKRATDYQGARTAKGIADAATAALTDKLISRPTSVEAFTTFLASSALPKVVLYSNKQKTSTLYKSLSMRFKERLTFAEVRESAKDLIQAEGVATFPSLLVIFSDGIKLPYYGKLKADALVPFLSQMAKDSTTSEPATDQESTKESGAKSDGAKSEAGEKGSTEGSGGSQGADKEPQTPAEIVSLDLEKLDKVLDEDDVWLIATYQGSDDVTCSKETSAFAKLAGELGPLAKFGSLNTTSISRESLAERGIAAEMAAECNHSLVLKQFGEQSEPDDPFPLYAGNVTAKDVQAFVLTAFTNEVQRLRNADMDAYMNFERNTPKVILFTAKNETPAVFRALAANGRAMGFQFAEIHESETAILKEFNIKKVPSMLLVVTDGEKVRAQILPPSFRYQQMYSTLQQISKLMKSARDGKGGAESAGAGSGKVTQIDDNATFAAECSGKLGLCVIGVLNPALPAFAQQLDELTVLAKLRSSQPLQFVWVDATKQPSFVEAFGLQRSDTPAAIVLAAKKLRFKILPGSFDAKNLDSLLDGLLSGRERTMSIQELPRLVDGGEEVADAAVEEDEFDLADIMGEGLVEPEGPGRKTEL